MDSTIETLSEGIALLLFVEFVIFTVGFGSAAIISYIDYRAHRKMFLRLTHINNQRIDELRNPKPVELSNKPKRGRPTDAERKRRAEAARRAAELKQSDNA